MFKLDYKVERIYCVGDIHGDFNLIIWSIKNNEIKDALLIFCGDIGFGFEKYEYYTQTLTRIERVCSDNNVYCVFFRGNHDDPSYFNGKKIKTDHIIAVPDYTVLNVETPNDNKVFLLVGGGLSIDRRFRIENQYYADVKYAQYHNISLEQARVKNERRGYWVDELPVYNEDAINDIEANGIIINYVCSHAAPDFVFPLTKDGLASWMAGDLHLSEDADRERGALTKVYNRLKDKHYIRAWFYGHYHKNHFDEFNGIDFHCVDMARNGKLSVKDVR